MIRRWEGKKSCGTPAEQPVVSSLPFFTTVMRVHISRLMEMLDPRWGRPQIGPPQSIKSPNCILEQARYNYTYLSLCVVSATIIYIAAFFWRMVRLSESVRFCGQEVQPSVGSLRSKDDSLSLLNKAGDQAAFLVFLKKELHRRDRSSIKPQPDH